MLHCSRCPEPALDPQWVSYFFNSWLDLLVDLTALRWEQHMSMRPLAKNQEQPPALRKMTPLLVPGMSCPACLPCHALILPQGLGWASPGPWSRMAMSVQGSAWDNPPLHIGRVKWEKGWIEEVKHIEAEQSSEPPWWETPPIHVTYPGESGMCWHWRCDCGGMLYLTTHLQGIPNLWVSKGKWDECCPGDCFQKASILVCTAFLNEYRPEE